MIPTLYPIFQHWSKTGSVYIISDTHFGDPDREYMGYNITEEEQIKILKKTVHKQDTLIHLGDVGDPSYFKDFPCYKVLIMGNHDQSKTKFEHLFNEIYTGPLWIAEKLVLSHEILILQSQDSSIPIAFNIHGHNHSLEGMIQTPFHLNLAQNVYGYEPLNLKNWIKTGYLGQIDSVHRATIDYQTEKKRKYYIIGVDLNHEGEN